MHQLSKSAAEEAGWVFFHEQEERTETIANRPQVIPASYRAEKVIDDQTKLTEEGETMELLLERIHAAECNLAGVPVFEAGEVELPTSTAVYTDEDGEEHEEEVPAGEVIVRDASGEITKLPETVLASRSTSEALVLPAEPDEDSDEEAPETKMVFVGPIAEAVEADQAKQALESELTDEASAEPVLHDEVESVYVPNADDSVDSPGQSAGSSLVVPAGELSEVQAKRDKAAEDAENARVEADEAAVKGESSEIPDAHESAAGLEKAEANEAAEAKAKELRDGGEEVGPAQEASEAGAEVAQEAHDEHPDPAQSDQEPDAQPSAIPPENVSEQVADDNAAEAPETQ